MKLEKKGSGYTYSEEELIQFLIRFKEEEGWKKLTSGNFNSHTNYPSSRTISNHFGSWNKALDEAGIARSNYTNERILELLVRFKEQEDEDLTYDNFDNNPRYPSSSTVRNHFGTWNKALKEANIRRKVIIYDKEKSIKHVSSAKAYSVGALLGDGCISERDDSVILKLSAIDKEFVCEFGCRVSQWLSITWKGFSSDATDLRCRKVQRDENRQKEYIVTTNITNLSKDIREVYNYDKSKLKAEFSEHKEHLIRGLWDSEGHIQSKDGRIGFTNTDKRIVALYIDLVCSVLDISLDTNPKKDNLDTVASNNPYISVHKKEHEADRYLDIYSVYIHNIMCADFYDKVNPTINRKRRKFRKHM